MTNRFLKSPFNWALASLLLTGVGCSSEPAPQAPPAAEDTSQLDPAEQVAIQQAQQEYEVDNHFQHRVRPIFDCLDHTTPGKGGEIQLTDAMKLLLEREPIHGVVLCARRHDIGNPIDWLKTKAPFWKKEIFRDGAQIWVECRSFLK